MKKPFIAFSIVCACATGAFADHGQYEQWQNPWFKAIGDGATKEDPNPTGGTWGAFNDGVSFVDNKMVLDQDDGQSTVFNITADATNDQTIVEVTATAAFYPVLRNDLPEVLPAGAKVAFAVVKENNALTYRAMVTNNTSTVWTTLGGTPASSSTEVTVLIQLNYREGKAKFFVGDTEVSADGGIAFDADAVPSGFTINGCGTIASINSEVQVGVAKWNDNYYGTIADAQNAATNSTGSGYQEITVLEPTAEPVTVGGSVKIEDNGNMTGTVTVPAGQTLDVVVEAETVGSGTSGTYTVPVKASGEGNIVLNLPTSVTDYKEIREQHTTAAGVEVTLQTRSDIMTNAVTASGCGVEVKDNLRAFMLASDATMSNAYVAAEANATDIGNALKAIPTAVEVPNNNGLERWKDYVLGIKPTDSVKPVTLPAGDTDADNITLAIPAIDKTKYSGDYDNIYYKVGDSSYPNPSAIKIPLSQGTGTYEIKIQFANDAQ